MKKLLLAFIVVVGFAQQATAGMYEMMMDLLTMHAIVEQMQKEAQLQEKRTKKILIFDVRNILKSSEGKNLFKNSFSDQKRRDLSSFDMTYLINTYKINRE